MAWFWAPVHRHGVRVPGSEGLLLANTTIESDAGPVDICAYAALEAATSFLPRARSVFARRLFGYWQQTAASRGELWDH